MINICIFLDIYVSAFNVPRLPTLMAKFVILDISLSICEFVAISRLTVVSREAKEEVPCDGLLTDARKYFIRTNLVKNKKCHNLRAFYACASLLKVINVLSR